MNDEQYRVIVKRIDTLQKGQDIMSRDQEEDRKEFEEIVLKLGMAMTEIRQLKDAIAQMPRKVADKVDDALSPATDEVKDLRETIESKKTMPIKMNKKRRWYFLWII